MIIWKNFLKKVLVGIKLIRTIQKKIQSQIVKIFKFSINSKIEFKSTANFLAFSSSKDIRDSFDTCFIVLRSIVMWYKNIRKVSLKLMIYNMVTIEEFKKKQSYKVRLIGLDIGTKRIGVSICDKDQSIATPFKTIYKTNIKDLISNLKKIIEENNVNGIIIGNPINMDGTLGKSAQSVKDISNNIANSIDLPICLWDERLSTVGAFNLTSQLEVNVTKRERDIDKNAATFILQGALDYLNN